MNQHAHGWALLEIIVAMALLALTVLATTRLQTQAWIVTQRAMFDAQSLGLAIEAVEAHAIGLHPRSTNEYQWRLSAIDPSRRIEMVYAQPGVSVRILQYTDDAAPSVRWQWPPAP